jgi:anaerobic selenocysteine-containing dehydrogenase
MWIPPKYGIVERKLNSDSIIRGVMTAEKTFTHYRTCNLCEAMCGIAIDIEDGRIKAIRGDKDDPFSQGHICPKATALQDVYEDPNRLKHPVKRTAHGWERISWDEAFDTVAARIQAVQAEHGKDSVGIYLGNPNVHNLGSLISTPPLVRALRTRNRFSATSVDQLPHHFAALFMFGHQLLLPIPDVDRTQYFLVLGANPVASNGSLMTAGGIEPRLKALQARGGKLIVLDPRRTETAKLADEHHFIKPGTDALFLLGMLHVLFAENLVKIGRLANVVDDVDTIQALVDEFTPETVAAATGIDAATIRRITHDFVAAESAVCYGRVGVSMQAFGGLGQWLLNTINILTGNLDEPGGAMFTLPAFDVVGLTSLSGQVGNFARWRSRVRQLPEFGGELPVAALAEDILTPGEGQIRCMVTSAGNPVLSTPNGTQLEKALSQLDFMVSIDIYINETTRHAHIILPPATGLETDHYDLAFHAFAVRNTAKYSQALFPKDEDARYDWEIMHALRARLENHAKPARRDYLKKLKPHQLVDMALRFGPYGAWSKRRKAGDGLTLAMLKRLPHGVDLGALQSLFPARLATPSKRINLAPEILINDLARLKATFLAPSNGNGAHNDLLLIGRRHVRSNNSWMHNSLRLVRGKNRCTLMMHPQDAIARQLSDGQDVAVQSRVGRVTLPVEITEDIMPGVVSMPHGFGHTREGVQLDVAAQHAGASINDLTDDQRLDDLTGNAAFSGVPVTVMGE